MNQFSLRGSNPRPWRHKHHTLPTELRERGIDTRQVPRRKQQYQFCIFCSTCTTINSLKHTFIALQDRLHRQYQNGRPILGGCAPSNLIGAQVFQKEATALKKNASRTFDPVTDIA